MAYQPEREKYHVTGMDLDKRNLTPIPVRGILGSISSLAQEAFTFSAFSQRLFYALSHNVTYFRLSKPFRIFLQGFEQFQTRYVLA